MVFCPMRILPCEPGMTACNRPLHAWFHIEERKYDRDLLDTLHADEGGEPFCIFLVDYFFGWYSAVELVVEPTGTLKCLMLLFF